MRQKLRKEADLFILTTFLALSLFVQVKSVETTTLLTQKLIDLKTTAYRQMYHKPINVSIGQQLTIVLPSFDSVYNKETILFKHLTDDQYQKVLGKLESLNVKDQDDFQNQDDETQEQKTEDQKIGTEVSQSELPLKCNSVPSVATVYQTISKISDQSGFSRMSFQNKIYVHVNSRQLLYILNIQSMLLSVYYYNDLNIKFLSSFQLPVNKQDDELDSSRGYTQSHSSVSMSLNSKESELYVFSPNGIWVVQTKTFLTNIKKVPTVAGLNTVDIGGLDKVIRGSGSYFVAMKKMTKVFIVPQLSTNERSVFTEITAFNDEHIFPQDIAMHSSHLFILDVYKGIYIFRVTPQGKAKQLFKISLPNYGGNNKIHVFQMNTLFVNFNDFDGSKIVQINIDVESQKAELVRYFKNDDYISFLQTYSVLTSSTGFYLSDISTQQDVDIKHIRNSAQSLLFMVSNYQEIQIFPFNIDPRTINVFFNGVKIYYPKVKQVHHVFGDRFLIMTEDTIDYVKISIQKPEVRCLLGHKYNQNYRIEPEHLQIVVKSNISSCQYRNKLLHHKVFYNQNCELTTQYVVHLNDPQKSSFRKLFTYGVVVFVVIAFVFGLFCLVKWRNQKLVVLSRLKDEIIKFRNRHRRMQPFVEEQQPEKKEVEMEVPKDVEYIPNEEEQN